MTVTKKFKVKTNKTQIRKSRTKSRKSSKTQKKHNRTTLNDSYKRISVIGFVLILATTAFSIIYGLIYLQNITADLPNPDKPFGVKATATEVYDKDGNLLYRVFDEEDRDPVNLNELPPLLVWSYLSAEDIRFFDHEGVDPQAILRCSAKYLQTREVSCGASTITQQLIRKTALSDEVQIDRKLKEMILAMTIEQDRSKEEIMEMYLTIVPSGSNIYGVTRASKFYFGKEPQELTLAEMAILASIPQNPSVLSPTKSTNPKVGPELLEQRVDYVFDQMEDNIDYINNKLTSEYGDKAELLTLKDIKIARAQKVKFKDPRFDIKSPHFVFYALEKLQSGNYNKGDAFSLQEIETQGLRIYTTLDSEMQKSAEQTVKKAVESYGTQYGAKNAGMVVMNPNNGEVLAMVGSYDYFGKASPSECKIGNNCKFEPQVNLVNTRQAYGSTLKPLIYYQSFMNGVITPETTIGDYPIKINDYEPKNYDNKFSGSHSTRYMLVNSRNIPAIILLDKIGTQNFLNLAKNWGYSTFDNPNGYGLSLAVGGGEINMIEHAQAYGVFANEGKLTKHEVIKKITTSDGKVIYEHKPKSVQVADARGIYLVNNILNGKNGGPGFSFEGRDIAGKTGTSDNQTETLYVSYSPEIVVAGILANNDNTHMNYGATGFTSVRPWIGEYLVKNASKFKPTDFKTPSGLATNRSGDLLIQGISSPNSLGFSNYYSNQSYPYPGAESQ